MYRFLKPLSLAAVLWGASSWGQEADVPADSATDVYAPTPSEADRMLFHSPPYLPRQVSLGAFVGGRLFVPEIRLTWELSLFHQRRDTLYLALEGGGGYGVGNPDTYGPDLSPPVALFYEHVLLAGVGYRLDSNAGFYFAIEGMLGALFYGGHINGFVEDEIVGTFEGRVKVGWRIRHVVLGVYAGDNAPFRRPPGSIYGSYAGDFLVGLFLNWH